MIKFTECLRRAPHMSREEFQDYWLNTHGPLVKSLAADLKMGRYVQSHTIIHPVHEFMQKRRGSAEPRQRFQPTACFRWESWTKRPKTGRGQEG